MSLVKLQNEWIIHFGLIIEEILYVNNYKERNMSTLINKSWISGNCLFFQVIIVLSIFRLGFRTRITWRFNSGCDDIILFCSKIYQRLYFCNTKFHRSLIRIKQWEVIKLYLIWTLGSEKTVDFKRYMYVYNQI